MKISTTLAAICLMAAASTSYATQDRCNRQTFLVAVDAGHSESQPGTISAHGTPEHIFNKSIANQIVSALASRGFRSSFLTHTNRTNSRPAQKARAANNNSADLLISIHHDSVQPLYMKSWTYNNKTNRYSDYFTGYSIFYSEDNPRPHDSLAFADILGSELLRKGFTPSMHHAERIKGESRQLIYAQTGVYRYDDLIILKKSKAPAILLECGIIANRAEERKLTDPAYQRQMVTAIANAVETYCSTDTQQMPAPSRGQTKKANKENAYSDLDRKRQ